ncbi:MAG: T9SS type A sorting domain-containing protein [candidate division KSB1 bacterium]|nr:T9SS type A sorting domain-containing protein [candidate division KSB1 bacterium]MDZ7300998.1 T9SS type A sorting domain-containing protein [candidate division KSB1 bacterium]MDZ7310323.1 T9SS type A sorting domain-containing protein [candidate division KSB1 bacterium]
MMPSAVEEQQLRRSYPIPGSDLLWKEQQQVRDYVAQHPDMMQQMKLQKSTVWNFKVGDTNQWYAYDQTTSQYYLVPSTCRAVGTNCYIFVENALWGSSVNQRAVDSVRVAFDQHTPANSKKGVYQMVVETFGDPPNVDNDPRIIILILDIRDGWEGTGGWVAGRFDPRNETTLPNSNRAEIYYLDANPTELNDSEGLAEAMSVTAHEFQHMVHWNYDQSEIRFMNEGCSLVAEVHCGFPIFAQYYYVNETNHYLLDWRSDITEALGDYSRAARFMTYVRDQVGIGVFKHIVASKATAIAGFDDGLQKFGSTLRFNDIFRNWVVANILDDRTLNPAYGYVYPNLPKATSQMYINPNVPLTGSTVQNLGVEYLTFKYGTDLRAKFTTEGQSILIKAVEIGSSSKRVLDVTPNVEFAEPEYGSTYKEIHFVVANTNQSFPLNFSYQASGVLRAVEQKWDETEPNGFLRLSFSDTICVTFDAIPGGKLDSIRVALRRKGAITGGVWQFTGNVRPTPLGRALAFPITASTNETPPVVNPGGEFPYPVPYPNWRGVDLRSYNISTDQPFAVGFVIRVPDTPAVLITKYPGQSPYHSFTYLNNPGSGSTPNWYYITADASNIWIYLIRAYVSVGTVGVEQSIELQPLTFALSQNYPNPFNPSTTIEFLLPVASRVALKIYNALGEEVSTLVTGKLAAGKHQVVWNASGLPSGVYFYRLESGGGFVETKKLLLIK